MRKLLIAISLLLCFSSEAQERQFSDVGAGDESFECSSETVGLPKKMNWLTVTQGEYNKLGTLRAKFRQNAHIAALDESEESSGVITYEAPGKMRWRYEEPEPQDFLINGEELTLYQPIEKQVLKYKLRDILITELPVSFLLGVGHLDRDFKLTDPACRNEHGVVLNLKAKDEERNGDLKEFKLLLDTKSYLPIGAQVVDVGGNINRFLFSALEQNPDLEPDSFELDIPDRVDVLDQLDR